MIKSRGITTKLILLILSSVTLIFLLIFVYNYRFSSRLIIKNIEENATNLAKATVNRIDMMLRPVEAATKSLAYFLENSSYTGDELNDFLYSMVENNPEIYGAAITFEPYAFNKDSLFYAPYFYKSENEIKFKYVPYDYFHSGWYKTPKELNRAAWIEPYFGRAGGIVMSTYSVPFYKKVSGKKQFMGIIAADISLSWLQKIIASIKIAQTGYGFLISKNGTFVTHPDSSLIMNQTIFSVAEARQDDSLFRLGKEMIEGKSGYVPFSSILTGKKCWMVYAPLSTSRWSLGVLFPQDELMSDITRLNRTVILLGLAGFFFLLAVIILIARSITRPLRALSKAAEDIASGNLNIKLPVIKSGDEVGRLADSFDYMKSSLKKYIEDLTKTTAAKERIESELKIAHDIQMGILPKIFPPFPDRRECDIYAAIKPAKEVGGDLYDFFFLDDDHLCITIGDVSGKGVPASLFMAITITLIKAKATKGLTPGKVLHRVNEDLSLDNPSLMFVTLFIGILNVRTGELEYCNGGHNPPYLILADGTIKALEGTNGMALGVMEDFLYKSKKIVLQKGESVFLYTDGVTEAMNKRDELFSEKRLEEKLSVLKEKSVNEIVAGIMQEITVFSQEVEQSDDITMIALKFYGE